MFPWGANARRDSKSKLEDEKDKQIRLLKTSFPSIRRPNNDDSLFEMKIFVDGVYSSLRIVIPTDFPHTRPVLQVVGPLTHPWLDQFKQVAGNDKLLHWSKNSSLVDIVEDTLATLMSGRNVAQTSVNNVSLAPNTSNSSYQNRNSAIHSTTYVPLGESHSSNVSNSYPAIPAIALPTHNSSTLSYLQSKSSSTFPQNYPNSQYPLQQPLQYPQQQPIYYSQQPPAQYPQQDVSTMMTHSAGPSFNYSQASSAYYSATTSYVPVQQKLEPSQSQPLQPIKQMERNGSHGQLLSSTRSSSDNLSMLNPGFIEKKGEHDSKLFEPEVTARTPVPMPDLPKSFAELEKLTTAQLERLNNDEAAIEAHVKGVGSVESMISLRDQMRNSNFEIASNNLVMEVELHKLHREAEEIKFQLQQLSTGYKDKVAAAALKHEVKRESVIAAVNAKKDKLDGTSEDIALKFVDGEIDLNTFKQEYLDTRIKYHIICGKLSLGLQ